MSELPSGWVEAPIRDLCELINGKAFKPSDWSTDGLPIVRIQNLNNSNSSFNYYQGVVEEKFRIDSGQLLFAWSGTPGTSFGAHVWGGGQAVLNQHIFKVNFPSGLIDKHFLRNAINQKLEELIGKAHGGAGLQHVTKGKFEETLIALPPLAEQERIMSKLDTLNAKSARARTELIRVETLVSRYKQGVLSKAFSGKLTPNFEGGTSLGPLDSDAEVTQLWSLPETWSWCRTDQIGRVGLGRQRSPKNHEGPQMRPYLRSANITWQGVDTSDVKKMNFDHADFERFKLEVGDVLLNEGSGSAKEVGKPAIWKGEISDCCYQNTLLRVQPYRCSSEYAYYYFLLTARAGRFVSSTQGVNIQHIGREGLACYPFPLAPEAEQHEIVARIESAFAKIDRLAKEAKRALELVGRLDEAILAKAFRGELVPQDENDEPAEKLLERVSAERAATPKAKRKSIRRKSTMPTAKTFLNEKMRDWPEDGISFQKLRAEFSGSYDDLKEAVFSSLSDEEPMLQQVFDDKNSTMTLRKRGR
jgi:type I restriction enzyme S subunit